ncbi:hypothetical protein LTS18_006313, partial [Coniosporium uncinatum]
MGSIEEILERVKRLKIDNADATAALKDHNDEQLDVVTAKIFSELESVKANMMKEVKAALQGTQKTSANHLTSQPTYSATDFAKTVTVANNLTSTGGHAKMILRNLSVELTTIRKALPVCHDDLCELCGMDLPQCELFEFQRRMSKGCSNFNTDRQLIEMDIDSVCKDVQEFQQMIINYQSTGDERIRNDEGCADSSSLTSNPKYTPPGSSQAEDEIDTHGSTPQALPCAPSTFKYPNAHPYTWEKIFTPEMDARILEGLKTGQEDIAKELGITDSQLIQRRIELTGLHPSKASPLCRKPDSRSDTTGGCLDQAKPVPGSAVCEDADRAAASTMKEDYTLPHPDTDEEVVSCDTCFKQLINSEYWNCLKCKDHDVCHSCYLGRWYDPGCEFCHVVGHETDVESGLAANSDLAAAEVVSAVTDMQGETLVLPDCVLVNGVEISKTDLINAIKAAS